METLEVNKSNVNVVLIKDNKFNGNDRLSPFSSEFIRNKKHLILDANEVITFEDSKPSNFKFTISCKHLFPSDMEIIKKYFRDKWMLSTGVLDKRDLIIITILE